MKAVNLLPPDLRGAAKPASARGADEPTGRMGAFAVLGALAFCVVALAAYVLTTNTVKDRQAQLDQVSAEAAAVSQQAAKLKPYADFAAQAQQRIQTVKDLASARFDWEQAMRDVSRAVPSAVTLSTLTGTISTGSGSTGGTLRAAIPAPAIEMTGCTAGGQSDVATLLSRLRDVDGVTRVSLESSRRPDPGAQSTTTATPSAGGAPAGCGAGRPATFSLVVFFEHSTVPATVDDVAAGSSGAAATSATGAASAANGAASSSSTSSSASSSTPTSTSSGSSTSTPTSTTTTP